MTSAHRPKNAQNVGLKEAMEIGLDEAFASLEESIYDLNDAQIISLPIPNRNNIVWIAMHCLFNLDNFAYGCHTMDAFNVWAERWKGWEGPRWSNGSPLPKEGDTFPSQKEVMNILRTVRGSVMTMISEADNGFLHEEPLGAGKKQKKRKADFYIRTIHHTMAHVRQIWLLRGALGLVDGKSWPRQQWW